MGAGGESGWEKWRGQVRTVLRVKAVAELLTRMCDGLHVDGLHAHQESNTVRAMLQQCTSSDWSGRVKGLSALGEAVLETKRRSEVVSTTELIGTTLTERLQDRNYRVRVCAGMGGGGRRGLPCNVAVPLSAGVLPTAPAHLSLLSCP